MEMVLHDVRICIFINKLGEFWTGKAGSKIPLRARAVRSRALVAGCDILFVMDIRVKLLALFEEGDTGVPVLLLHDEENDRVLPIWIGVPEAQAIAIAHGRLSTERPLSHQLFCAILKAFSVSVKAVRISKINGGTFFAELSLSLGDLNPVFDARPSDAVALALHYNAPIFVDDSVMRTSSFPNPFARTRAPITRQQMSSEEIERLKRLLSEARQREESR